MLFVPKNFKKMVDALLPVKRAFVSNIGTFVSPRDAGLTFPSSSNCVEAQGIYRNATGEFPGSRNCCTGELP